MKTYTYSAFGDEISDDLLTQISVLKKHDISSIDIRSINKKNVLDFSDEDINNTKHILRENDINVSSIASPIGKASIEKPFGEIRNQLVKAIRVAEAFDCCYIRIFSFYPDKPSSESTYDDLVRKATDRLKSLSDIANKNGKILSLENEKGTIADDPIITRRIIEQIESGSLSVVFDFANYVRSGIDTVKAFKLLRQYIVAFHMKDALYEKDIVVPSGLGDGKQREVLKLFFGEDYNCFFSIEPHLRYYSDFIKLESNGKQIRDYNNMELFSIAYQACRELIMEVEWRKTK